MEMESSRRPPFDRSRDLIAKKPRLSEEPPPPRQFQPPVQRPPLIGSGRLRAPNNVRDREPPPPQQPPIACDDSIRGAALQHQELVNQYKTALAELTFNSKPIITNLTIIAGENLQAAKAIAGTICANILEVPSDQKLPSLYLLDSIVKNIGRDYIKHFAARLPEVFCKAYRQVDPSIHPGMRHLFGTWKGVFPFQPLQFIEKELGFPASVNGPSSGTTTSKSDSQAQRQPHSIHVNPKYLEARQRLQQSSKMKSADNLIDVGSSEDVERSERIAGAGTERSWMDPSAKLHSIRPQREPLRESSLQKQGGGVYGDYDFAPGLSRPLSTSVGKPSDRVAAQRWLGGGQEVEESVSGQRNGYDVKKGIPNSAAVRPASNIPSILNQPRTATGISRSWKNSEEEEFMWEDLGTKVDSGATAVTKKDIWSEDVDRLELGTIPKWRSPSEVRSHFEREHSSDTSSSEQKEHLPFGLPRNSHPSLVGVSSFGFPSTAISASSGRLPSAGQSGINLRPPSPSLSKRDPRHNVVEKDHLRSYSLARSDPRAVTFPGKLNASVSDKNIQNSIPSRLPNLDVQTLQSQKPSSPTPYFQQRHHIPPPEQLSSSETELPGIDQKAQLLSSLKKGAPLESPNPIANNTQGKSNVSDLLAAVMKTGLLSGTAVKEEKPSLPPEAPVSSSPTSSVLTQSSNLAAAKSNPLSILSTLISKGLISAPKAEAPTAVSAKPESPLTEQSPTVSDVSGVLPEPKPSSENISSLEPDETKSITIQSTEEVKDLIGYEFLPRVLRDFHPAVIDKLCVNLAHRCTECGIRFKLQERLVRHSDWHALKNSISNCLHKPSRRWYSNSREWISGKAGFPFGYKSSCQMEGSHRMGEDNEKTVPADESQCVCLLCGELFEDFYSQDKDEWMYKGAVYLSTLSGSTEGGSCSESGLQSLIVHAACVSGDSGHDLELIKGVKVEKGT